jgi:ribosome biogenesis GTPase A
VSGAIKDTAMDYREAALFAATYLMRHYADMLIQRYSFNELPESPYELLEEIGRRKGCLLKGGVVDDYRAAERFIHDYRSGKMGRVSLENPLDLEQKADGVDEVLAEPNIIIPGTFLDE